MTKKNKIILRSQGTTATMLTVLTNGLVYISETDAEIIPFNGDKASMVTADEILKQAGHEPDALVETVSAEAFFERLIAIKEWFGDSEKERAARFARLKEELAASLSDLTGFRIGKIRIDIQAKSTGLLPGKSFSFLIWKPKRKSRPQKSILL